MKNDWQSKTLEEVCEFSNGLWKGEQPPFVNVGVIRNTNFAKDGRLDDSDIAYLDVESKKFEKRRLQLGDIILEKSGGGPKQPVGRVALFDKEEGAFSFSNFTAALRVRDRRELDFRFLHFFLLWTYVSGVTEGMQSHTTGIRNLDGSAYKAIKIAIPSLPEQHRLVAILDEAFEGIATAKANAEQNIRNARAIFDSYLQSVFSQRGDGWVDRRLGELSHINYGYTESASTEKVGPKFLRITDIQDNRVDWSSVPYCPIESSAYPKYRLSDGDIVFARTGATTGKSYLVTSPPESVFASYLIRVQLETRELLPQFVNLFFQTQSYWDSILSGISGSAQGGFNATKLSALMVPFPQSQGEQTAIVTKLDALRSETNRLAGIQDRKLTALDALKRSLFHQAFSGTL